MRDVVRELEAFESSEPPTTPPSPGAVRRRGERLRRRRVALTLVGAVAAVALVVTPLSLALDGDHDAAPLPPTGPVTSPAGGWVQQIPEDFPVDAGLPVVGPFGDPLVDGVGGHASFVGCSERRPVATVHDQLTVSISYSQRRVLQLYPDAASADEALQAVVGNDRCHAETADLGDDARVWTDRGWIDDARVVVRVGNALLLASGPDDEEPSYEPVVAAMCVFAAEPCARPPAPAEAPTAAPGFRDRIPADLDLGPGDSAGAGVPVCADSSEQPVLAPGVLDQRRSGSVDGARTLLLYADDAAAGSAFASIRAWLGVCAARPAEGQQVVTDDGPLGDLALVTRITDPGTGAGATYTWFRAMRVGSALLLTENLLSSDLGASDLDGAVASQGDALADLLDQLQVFEPESATSSSRVIPDDFPITTGLPDLGGEGHTRGPGRSVSAFTGAPCGQSVADPPHVDRLSVTLDGPAEYHDREVTVFDTAEVAHAYGADVLRVYQDCPSEETESGAAQNDVVLGVLGGPGDESGVAVATQGVHVLATTVVRAGRSVLVAHDSTEGGQPYPPVTHHALVDNTATQAQEALRSVVDALDGLATAGTPDGAPRIPTASELPTATALDPWQQLHDPGHTQGAVLGGCVTDDAERELLGGDLVAAYFTTSIDDTDPGPVAHLAERIHDFSSETAARSAAAKATRWIDGCSAAHTGPLEVHEPRGVGDGVGGFLGVYFDYHSPSHACGTCLPSTWTALAVSRIDTRVVLTSFTETSAGDGSLPPAYPTLRDKILTAVVETARP